jgi:hypothetical protein
MQALRWHHMNLYMDESAFLHCVGKWLASACWLARIGYNRSMTRYIRCDILTQGLIGLIEYSYHQGIPSFPKAQLQ